MGNYTFSHHEGLKNLGQRRVYTAMQKKVTAYYYSKQRVPLV